MDISKALDIFKIDNIANVNKDEIKKIYRRLMRENHPDLGGSQEFAKSINEAKEILDQAVNSMQQYNVRVNEIPTIIISLGSLVDIYNGKTVKVSGDKGELELTRSNINRYNAIIEINIDVQYNGISCNYHKFEARNSRDEFTIQCKYRTRTLSEEVYTKIQAYGKNINIILKDQNVNMNLMFDGLIKLKVMLERQLMLDDK